MTVRLAADGAIELAGACGSADAQILQTQLLAAPAATVDWRACVQAHAAVIQVLLAAQAPMRGPPAGDELRLHVAPLLKSRAAAVK